MTENLRLTVRSFLQSERPSDRDEAQTLVKDWFGRYDPDPEILNAEIARHFAQSRGEPAPVG
jgi:hypothetical protein